MAGKLDDLAPFLIASGEIDAHGNAHQSAKTAQDDVTTARASVNDTHNTALNADRAALGVAQD